MSSVGVVWGVEAGSKIETIDSVDMANSWIDLPDWTTLHRSKEWIELLRARWDVAPARSKGATSQDEILDSPTWLGTTLQRLQSRGFVRSNDPRRRQR